MPKVSVVLNCYRQAPYVREAVESVLRQSYGDYELIAIDNGSPDETPAILSEYRGNPHVRLHLHKENRTISSRFNEGVRAARGDFIAFLYSDDYYLPHKLATQLRLFEQAPANVGVVYAPLRVFNQHTKAEWTMPLLPMGPDALASLFAASGERVQIDMISPLTRREVFLKRPFLDDVFAEGEGYFFRAALEYGFLADATPVAVMRDTGENRGKAIRANTEMHEVTLRALEADPMYRPERHGRALRSYRARMWRNAGFCLSRIRGEAADATWARHAFARAVKLAPHNALHYRTLFGLGLLTLPSGLRAQVNAVAHRLRGRKETTNAVAGYGGSSGT